MVTSSKWSKQYSKTHNAFYWFNSENGETSWSVPEGVRDENHESSAILPVNGRATNPEKRKEDDGENDHNPKKRSKTDIEPSSIERRTWKPHVAVIVPFRDLHAEQNREAHLRQFVPHMSRFLERSGLPFRIYIIEQSNDQRKFNRGKLLNIGFVQAQSDGCQVFVFHDVDLLPSDDLLPYYVTVPSKNPVHIAAVWNRYTNNAKYFGGVNAFSAEMFTRMNGFPNNFWGWGGEDDELFLRSHNELKFRADKPKSGSFVDLEDMSIDQKIQVLRENSLWKCMNRKEVLNEHHATWRSNGLSDLRYQELRRQSEYICPQCVRIEVDVMLNHHWTDLACGVEATQLEETADALKERFHSISTSSSSTGSLPSAGAGHA